MAAVDGAGGSGREENGRRKDGKGQLFDARLSWLGEPGNARLIRSGLRGLEKESLRVDAAGKLSTRPHPAALGSALTHPNLTTDYSEALLEFVTSPEPSARQTLDSLSELHAFVYRRLDGELLWPASMPCLIGANEEIPIAEYGTSNIGRMKHVYRRGLGHRYGRAMQAIAGVHFNFSPPVEFWPAYADFRSAADSSARFRSAELLALARNYRRCAWLVIYLFGASPALGKSFRPGGHEMLEELDAHTWFAPYATSLRMSDLGYRNTTQARLDISLNSPREYIDGLKAAVTTADPRYEAIGLAVDGEYKQLNANILQIENEYYSPIRPKPGKDRFLRPTVALQHDGVEYVEVRTLDLSPADPAGVNEHQLRFLEALLIHCLLQDSPPVGPDEQREIDARDLTVAREGRRPGLMLPRAGRLVPLREWGLELLEGVEAVAALLDEGGPRYSRAVGVQREALEDPDATPSARLLDALKATRTSFYAHALGLARAHREHFMALPLASAREAALDAQALASLVEQRRLELEDAAEPFSAFLERYFAET